MSRLKLFRLKVTDIGLFQIDDPFVLAEFPGKLTVPHIDGKNL